MLFENEGRFGQPVDIKLEIIVIHLMQIEISSRNLIVSHGQRSTFDKIRSEEHTSELQSLMRISYAVFCLKKKKQVKNPKTRTNTKSQLSTTSTSNKQPTTISHHNDHLKLQHHHTCTT